MEVAKNTLSLLVWLLVVIDIGEREVGISYVDRKWNKMKDVPEVGGTTGFGMPFNACGSWPAPTCANAAIGLIYVPCAVAAAIRAACCCK